MNIPLFRERCEAECTRNVIFLLQRRFKRSSDRWFTESVWLSREEATAFRNANAHNFPTDRWRVYGVPAEGALVELIKRFPESPSELCTCYDFDNCPACSRRLNEVADG